MQKQWNSKGKRGIEWCDFTSNPIGGCLHRCRWKMPNGSIAICYAEAVAEGVARAAYPEGFEHHYWRPQEMDNWGKAGTSLVFVDSMSDLFGAHVPEYHTKLVLSAMSLHQETTFMSLTKAAGRIEKFALPLNLWVGVSSAPDYMLGNELSFRQQSAYMEAALKVLGRIKEQRGNIVWMSLEPLSWDVSPLLQMAAVLPDFLVVGAASDGPRYIMPHPAWVNNVLRVADAGNVPVFFKGNLFPLWQTGQIGRWREDFPSRYRHKDEPIPAVIARRQNAEKYGWATSRY